MECNICFDSLDIESGIVKCIRCDLVLCTQCDNRCRQIAYEGRRDYYCVLCKVSISKYEDLQNVFNENASFQIEDVSVVESTTPTPSRIQCEFPIGLGIHLSILVVFAILYANEHPNKETTMFFVFINTLFGIYYLIFSLLRPNYFRIQPLS